MIPRIKAVSLSRNFGKEIAAAAGLNYATGDAAVLMDADLQHPPELIEEFVKRWREGFDIVYGRRLDRDADSSCIALSARAVLRRVREAERHRAAGGGRRFSPARPQGGRCHEPHARARAVQQGPVRLDGLPLDRRAVHCATAHERQLALAAAPAPALRLDGIATFTTIPLRVWSYLGLLISLFAFGYAMVFLVKTLVYGADVPGFPDPDHLRDVLCRRAAHLARRDRRVPRAACTRR